MFPKILENGKVRYYKKYYDETIGEWRQVTTTVANKTRAMKAQAEKILDEKIERKLNQSHFAIEDVTVELAYSEWQKVRKEELKESTYKCHEAVMSDFLAEFSKLRLQKLSSYSLQRFLMKKNVSKDYRYLKKTVINLFLKYCVKSRLLTENPMDYVVIPKLKKKLEEVKKQREKFLDSQSMKVFLNFLSEHADNQLFALFAEFLFLTGVRFGEGAALAIDNINMDEQYFLVEHTLHYRKGGSYYLSSPKTVNAYRKVYFNDRVKEIILQVQEIIGENSGPLFLFHGLPIKIGSFNTYLSRNFRVCGIDKRDFKMTSHVLRHSHISLLAELNVPIKVVMERVGHGDEKTTLSIYTHVTEKMTYDLRSKLESLDLTKG